MLSHGQIWTAIDQLASRYGLTASGLARQAGLDPTTFNKSKRSSPDGRLRWPSTESIAKILDATGASLDEFLSILTSAEAGQAGRLMPLLGLDRAGATGLFDDRGCPVPDRWDEVHFPGQADEHGYGLEVSSDDLLPYYRYGDILICAPGEAIRRGDRVVARAGEGAILIGELRRRTAKTLDIGLFHPAGGERTLLAADLAWIARIMWVSQ